MPFLEELGKGSQSFTKFLDALPIGICACNAEGKVVYYNGQAARMWGRAPDLTGLRWCGALQTYLTDGQPLAGEDSPMAELLTQKASVMDRELTYERPDGSRIHVLANLEPRFGPDGTFLGGINCFQDITARKKEEERARQAELFSRLIFDTTPDCIKVVSRDGLLVQMNQSGIEMVEGGCIDEIVGKPVADLVLPEFRDEWLANHARVCAGEKLAWEFDIRGLHGTTRKMSTHAAPIEKPDQVFQSGGRSARGPHPDHWRPLERELEALQSGRVGPAARRLPARDHAEDRRNGAWTGNAERAAGWFARLADAIPDAIARFDGPTYGRRQHAGRCDRNPPR